jgi:RNA polymerase sigma factor (TIGR02999 family)
MHDEPLLAHMDPIEPVAKDEIGHLLTRWLEGDRQAGERLYSTLHEELRRLARHQLRQHPKGATLDTTALIHETFLKLMRGSRRPVLDRGHFLALASRVMRQILVDSVRRKNASKRDAGEQAPLAIDPPAPMARNVDEILALDKALLKLESLDARLAQMVDLRFFGGMSVEETAEALGISTATLKRDWLRARAFLLQQMSGDGP